MSQKMKTLELIPHKDNDFFFDDITGEAWQEFIESIKTSGVIEPIVVTQNKVIVSGHQRVRACKLLGIEEIDAEVRIIDSDDEILKQLIETNIRQRGIGNANPVKFGRCLDELKRIYGIQHGGDRKSNPNNSDLITEEQLASSIGISVDTMENYIKLSKTIPEIQTLVETGIVTPTTARAIVKKLPEFQQKELAKQFAEKGEKVTGKEVNEKIKKLYSELEDAKEENKTLRDANKDLGEERDYYQQMYEDEKKKEPVKVEVPPADYESLKARIKELEESESNSGSEELEALKQQTIINAKMELADFVRKYSDICNVRELLNNCLYGLE